MPVLKNLITPLIIFASVAFTYSVTSIRNQELDVDEESSFASRIGEFEHGGLLYPRANSRVECVLMLYGGEQFEKLLKLRVKEKEEYNQYLEKREFLDKKKAEAQSRRDTAAESEINQKIRALPRPIYGLRPSVSYCDIVFTGEDYVELKFVDSPENNVLIPLHRIQRVELIPDSPPAEK